MTWIVRVCRAARSAKNAYLCGEREARVAAGLGAERMVRPEAPAIRSRGVPSTRPLLFSRRGAAECVAKMMMLELVLVVLTIAFFALMDRYAAGCEHV